MIGIETLIISTSASIDVSLRSLPDSNTKNPPLMSYHLSQQQAHTKKILYDHPFLKNYYARAIDSYLLVALNIAAQSQASPTVHTLTFYRSIIDYCATFQHTKLLFRASDMVLHVDSDATYFVASQAKSWVAGYFQLNHNSLWHVAASCAESETAGAFHNAQWALSVRYMLEHIDIPSLLLLSVLTTKQQLILSKMILHRTNLNIRIYASTGYAIRQITKITNFIRIKQQTT